jgi:hypothetical protein
MRSVHLFLPVLLAFLTTSACARPVDFEPDPRQAAAINVINEMPHAMILWFDDGSGERLLGTVAAQSTERFVIAGSDVATISVIARDEGETHTVRRTVALTTGGAVDVRLN